MNFVSDDCFFAFILSASNFLSQLVLIFIECWIKKAPSAVYELFINVKGLYKVHGNNSTVI